MRRRTIGEWVMVLRPGLAPEYVFGATRCPWLSRTAGRPVYRPRPLRLRMDATAEAVTKLGQAMRDAGQHVALAFGRFSEVLREATARARP
jgi:hypothetical protein